MKVLLFAVFTAGITYVLMPPSMPELGARMIGIFIFAALLWATEAIPLYATSLCVVGLEVLLLAEHGGLAGFGDLGYQQFLSPFSSGIIILFMGGFLLAKAVTKHGLDRVIAVKMLHPFARSPLTLIYSLMMITAFFSMWISNTATTAMMFAVLAPLLKDTSMRSYGLPAVVFAVAFGANIGGIGTPIGTPPNAICMAMLRDMGLEIGFLQWMLVAVPLMILLIGISGFLLYLIFRRQGETLVLFPKLSQRQIGKRGWWVSGILGLCVVLWLTSQWHGINEAVVALIAAALLTALGILDRRDVDSIDWNILILMWGGLSLSNAMKLTGLTTWIAHMSFETLSGFILPLSFVFIAVGLSIFMSNTAAANLIIPIAVLISASNPLHLALLTAFACSFGMALPISTPPNAIAFASGRVTARQFLIVGGGVSVVCITLLLMGYRVILPLVFPL